MVYVQIRKIGYLMQSLVLALLHAIIGCQICTANEISEKNNTEADQLNQLDRHGKEIKNHSKLPFTKYCI